MMTNMVSNFRYVGQTETQRYESQVQFLRLPVTLLYGLVLSSFIL